MESDETQEAYKEDSQLWEAQQEVFRLREALEVQGAELEALRRENQRLQAEGHELGKLKETLDALREESQRLELHERQVAELHEDLDALRQENERLQGLAGTQEELEQSRERVRAAEEEGAALRRALQRQGEELAALRCESQRTQVQGQELKELREALKLERIAASAQQYELMTLREFLKEKGFDLTTLEAQDESSAAQGFPAAESSAASKAEVSQAPVTPPPSALPPPADAAAGSPGRCSLREGEPPPRPPAPVTPPPPPLVRRSVEAAAQPVVPAATQAAPTAAWQRQKQPLVAAAVAADASPCRSQPGSASRERRILLDLHSHEQEMSGLSEIQDETVSLDSVLVERKRRGSRELEAPRRRETSPGTRSAPTPTLHRDCGRLDAQEEEIVRLRQALELQTANVDTLLREGRRLQALEGQLADLRGASPSPSPQGPFTSPRVAVDTQDASQRSASLATEEAWSLTSTSETSPRAGLGFESVTMSSPSQQFAACEQDSACISAVSNAAGNGRRCSADVEEPWRLVRAILGMLDGMQQKLGAGAADRAGVAGGERWRSVISIDIRILVGVGPSGAGLLGEEGKEEAGRTFMYVLL